MVARSADSLEEARKEVYEINPHIKVLAVPTDLLDPKSIKALWEKVKEEFGHADVLINNAGSALFSLVSEADPDAWW
jgi:NADP-dependent 3-hydroxy acid dehydrogenase YdfG